VPFEPIDHTGDVGFRLRAADLPGLVEAGVLALRSVLFEGTPEPGAPRERWSGRASGVDDEDALVQALSEALHAMQEGELFPTGVRARVAEGPEVEIEIEGVRADGGGVRRVEEIKAVTYHGVAIERAGDGVETDVVFDV
jgi:SHS2 domain-containing protein